MTMLGMVQPHASAKLKQGREYYRTPLGNASPFPNEDSACCQAS